MFAHFRHCCSNHPFSFPLFIHPSFPFLLVTQPCTPVGTVFYMGWVGLTQPTVTGLVMKTKSGQSDPRFPAKVMGPGMGSEERQATTTPPRCRRFLSPVVPKLRAESLRMPMTLLTTQRETPTKRWPGTQGPEDAPSPRLRPCLKQAESCFSVTCDENFFTVTLSCFSIT